MGVGLGIYTVLGFEGVLGLGGNLALPEAPKLLCVSGVLGKPLLVSCAHGYQVVAWGDEDYGGDCSDVQARGFGFRTFGLEWFLGGKVLCRGYAGHADMQGSRFSARDVGLGLQDLRARNSQP